MASQPVWRFFIRIAALFFALFLIGRSAAAQTPPPFSASVPAPIGTPGAVVYDPAFRITTTYMFNSGTRQADWFVKANGSGVLTITVQAGFEGNNGGPPPPGGGSIMASLFAPAGVTPLTSFTVTQPPLPPASNSQSATVGSTPGAVYRVHLSSPPAPSPLVTYRLKFDGAEEAGTASPLPAIAASLAVGQSHNNGTRWVMNVAAGEPLSFQLQPGAQPLSNLLVYVFDPSHQLRDGPVQAAPSGASITIPDAGNTPGPWVVLVLQPDRFAMRTYSLTKPAGADTGIYTAWFTDGRGAINFTINAPAFMTSLPLTFAPESASPTAEANGSMMWPTNSVFSDPAGVHQNHITVTPPTGWTAVPAVADVPITSDVTTYAVINIVDLTPPVISVPPDQTVHATSPAGASVTFPPATATDAGSGVASVTCDHQSGETFPLGTTTIVCTAFDVAGNSASKSFRVTVYNTPPACGAVVPSLSILWPPNHQYVPITVSGVTDADGDALSVVVSSIRQDEPVNSASAGNTGPDGVGVGTPVAQVRAERAGDPKNPGDGRVYHIGFVATDSVGGTCTGVVNVGVPHDQNSAPIDGGPLYDSTIVPAGLMHLGVEQERR